MNRENKRQHKYSRTRIKIIKTINLNIESFNLKLDSVIVAVRLAIGRLSSLRTAIMFAIIIVEIQVDAKFNVDTSIKGSDHICKHQLTTSSVDTATNLDDNDDGSEQTTKLSSDILRDFMSYFQTLIAIGASIFGLLIVYTIVYVAICYYLYEDSVVVEEQDKQKRLDDIAQIEHGIDFLGPSISDTDIAKLRDTINRSRQNIIKLFLICFIYSFHTNKQCI